MALILTYKGPTDGDRLDAASDDPFKGRRPTSHELIAGQQWDARIATALTLGYRPAPTISAHFFGGGLERSSSTGSDAKPFTYRHPDGVRT